MLLRRDSTACLPECLPSTRSVSFTPTLAGVMISYVSGLARIPCWWMPASWAKAFRPTIALLGCGQTPVMLASMALVGLRSSLRTPVEKPRSSPRTFTAITNSSSEALPARSPMPLIVHSTWRAPAWTAAMEFATASPRSLWQWTEMTAPGMSRTSFRTISA